MPSLSEYPPMFFLKFSLVYYNLNKLERAESCIALTIKMINLIESQDFSFETKTKIVKFWMNNEKEIYEQLSI